MSAASLVKNAQKCSGEFVPMVRPDVSHGKISSVRYAPVRLVRGSIFVSTARISLVN